MTACVRALTGDESRWVPAGYHHIIVLADDDAEHTHPIGGHGFPCTISQLRELYDALRQVLAAEIRA